MPETFFNLNILIRQTIIKYLIRIFVTWRATQKPILLKHYFTCKFTKIIKSKTVIDN